MTLLGAYRSSNAPVLCESLVVDRDGLIELVSLDQSIALAS